MIVDCHAHFEPRMLDVARVIEKMDAAGVDRVAMIPTMNAPLPATPERLLALGRVLMSRSSTRPLAELIHRATLTRSGDLRLLGKVYEIYARPDNASVASIVRAHPDRFWGWIFCNPRAEASPLEELERWRNEPGMIGVKLHPHWHDYPTELLTPLLARAAELKLPVLIHLGFGKNGDYRSICERFPNLVVIAAHAGFPFYRDLWVRGRAYPNLYVDLSSPYIDERLARQAVATLGPHRCLYGTDAPYGFHDEKGTYDYSAIKGWVDRFPVGGRAKDEILGGTFLKLIDARR